MHHHSILPLTLLLELQQPHNDFTKKIVAGNITTSIPHHLTQYLIIRDQTRNFEDNREKEFPKIQKSKYSFLSDLNKINWDNYLTVKYIKAIQTYLLSCF